MTQIKQTYKIHAPLDRVWDALVNPKTIYKWGGGPAKMKDREGYKFSLWGGDIHGKNIKVVPHELLEQDWYGGDWPEPSKVTFTLSEENGETTIELVHTGVPEDEVSNFDRGWQTDYMGPLKELLEK